MNKEIRAYLKGKKLSKVKWNKYRNNKPGKKEETNKPNELTKLKTNFLVSHLVKSPQKEHLKILMKKENELEKKLKRYEKKNNFTWQKRTIKQINIIKKEAYKAYQNASIISNIVKDRKNYDKFNAFGLDFLSTLKLMEDIVGKNLLAQFFLIHTTGSEALDKRLNELVLQTGESFNDLFKIYNELGNNNFFKVVRKYRKN